MLPDVKFDLESKLPSKLNPYVQEVVKELVSRLKCNDNTHCMEAITISLTFCIIFSV